MKKILVFVILMFCTVSFLAAEKGDLIAIPHIEASGTSEIEAETARSMIEVGLVKAGLYTVIANNDIETILEAQAFSLTGCTDESCAIEVGKLLAADRIVLGELVKIQDQYILNVRLINVSTGRTEKAESINIKTIEGLQEASYTAAFALSNQKYVAGMETGISEFGELYIEAPDNAKHTVFLDGKEKGMTPLLLKDIAFGVHLLQVKGEGYEFEQEINVTTKKIQKITADPDLLTGNLILSINPDFLTDYRVYIDGTEYETGLLEDIKSGKHFIYAVGEGWAGYSYFAVETGKTLNFTLDLSNETGSLMISRESGAETEMTFTDSSGSIIPIKTGSSIILPAGSYEYTITEKDYDTYRESVTLKAGDELVLTPELIYSRLFLLKQKHDTLTAELEQLRGAGDFADGLFWTGAVIGGIGLTGALTSEILIQLNIINIETKTSLLAVAATEAEAEELGKSINASILAIDPGLRIFRDILLITGGVGGVLAGTGLLIKPDITEKEARLKELETEIEQEATNE